MASQYLARLGIVLGVDSGELVTGIDKAKKEFKQFSNQVEKDTKAALREVSSLKDATEDYGRTLTKVEQIEREISKGRFMFAAQNVKDMLRAEAKAYDEKAASMKKMNGALTEQQKLAVTYQLTDFFTQIASGQNAFIAFLQQGGQLKDTMGGVGAAIRAVTSLITPARVAFGGLAAAVGAVAYAAYEADKEFDQLQDSLTLTGNYAGMSATKLSEMTRALADMGSTTIGVAVDALNTVVASGKFTATSIESVTKAILTYSKIAGVDGKAAAERLMSGLDGTAKGAKQLNDQMNFLTLAQYKQIEALEQAGKKQEAAKLVADILNEKLQAQKRVLGDIELAWDKAKNALSRYWDALKEAVFGPDTNEGMLKKTNEQIKALEFSMTKGMSANEKKAYEQRLEYLKARRDEIEKTIEAAKEAEVPSGEKGGISDRDAAGGIAKEKQLGLAFAKARAEAAYQVAVASANEIQKLELEAQKEISEKRAEYANRSEEEKRAFAGELARNLSADILAIEAKTQEKIRQLRVKNMVANYQEEERAREEANAALIQESEKMNNARRTMGLKYFEQERDLLLEAKRLRMEIDMVGASEKEMQIAQSRLALEKELRDIQERTDLDALDKETFKQRAQQNQQIREQNYEIVESLKYVRGMYDIVWNSMSEAIERFVRTGKLSIKDFTRSVIQEMLIMNMKLQAMKLVQGLFGALFNRGFGSNFASGVGTGVTGFGSSYADGGNPTPNTVNLVGERGPELFIPRTAGTIVPNNRLSDVMGGTTNVTNNYINAIDAKSFEQRLLESSSTIWAANTYANKSLASNGRRA